MVWNKIAKRFKGIRKHATGVVLAGPEPIDRECLRNAGFKDRNFIFVDSHLPHVQNARSSGLTGFHGDVFDYLLASGCRVDVLHLDFHCGISLAICNKIALCWLVGIIDWNSIVYVNFQRGRDEGNKGVFGDGHLTEWKEAVRNSMLSPSVNSLLDKPKHRGELFVIWIIKAMSWWLTNDSAFQGRRELLNQQFDGQLKTDGWNGGLGSMLEFFHAEIPKENLDFISTCMSACVSASLSNCRPETFSYRSNVVYMDSAIINMRVNSPLEAKKRKSVIAEFRLKNSDLCKMVSAAKAVQTKRQL